MPGQFQIKLLADFHLTCDGQPITGLETARLRSLLAFFLIHQGRAQLRSRIAFLFWPDSSEKQALTNLRNQLHKLRQVLPNIENLLEIGATSITWREDAPSSVDMSEFDRHLSEAGEAAQKGDAKRNHEGLARAVDWYGGELMPGLYGEWIESERERLSTAYGGALAKLTKFHEDRREYSEASGFANRLRRHEPTCEATYMLLIRIALLAGNRAEALQVYRDCEEVLRNELGVEPGSTLRAIHERLLAGEELDLTGHDVSSNDDETGEIFLQGRHAEWAALKKAWTDAASGRASLLILTGDPGIGKTRLAEELFSWVTAQGKRAAQARSYASEGRLAFAPAADWLSSPTLKADLEKLDEVWISELGRILPDLRTNQPDPEPGTQHHDRSSRHRFFEALSRGILAAGEPLLLLLDDMQWSDQETLEWLRYRLRFAPSAPLLIVGTVRSEGIANNSVIERLLLDLRRDGAITEITVEAMGASESALVAQQIAGRELSVEEAAHLHSETEGNPLFVVESVRAGLLGDRATTGASGEFREVELPPKVQAVIGSRLEQLSKTARDVVSIGAVIGREFDFELLQRTNDYEEGELIDALDELWQRRVIREQAGAGRYDFAHDKLREVAYESISMLRRRFLHRRVAESLE